MVFLDCWYCWYGVIGIVDMVLLVMLVLSVMLVLFVVLSLLSGCQRLSATVREREREPSVECYNSNILG